MCTHDNLHTCLILHERRMGRQGSCRTSPPFDHTVTLACQAMEVSFVGPVGYAKTPGAAALPTVTSGDRR